MAQDSIIGDEITIWFAPADTDGDDLENSQKYQMEVTSFNTGGGETSVETTKVFGPGFISRKTPKTNYTLSADVIFRYGANTNRWEDIVSGATDVGCIVIQAQKGSNYKWRAYNNVEALHLNDDFNSDEHWTGTIEFELAPATPEGVSNYQYGANDVEVAGNLEWNPV